MSESIDARQRRRNKERMDDAFDIKNGYCEKNVIDGDKSKTRYAKNGKIPNRKEIKFTK